MSDPQLRSASSLYLKMELINQEFGLPQVGIQRDPPVLTTPVMAERKVAGYSSARAGPPLRLQAVTEFRGFSSHVPDHDCVKPPVTQGKTAFLQF